LTRDAALARPGEFDALSLITESHPVLRRNKSARRVPDDAPAGFIRTGRERLGSPHETDHEAL
jgi:hypothetical protein